MTNLGLTMEFVAEKMGITKEQVRKYTEGENGINSERLNQIADIANINIHYLVTGRKEEQKSAAYILSTMTQEESDRFWEEIFDILKKQMKMPK